MFNAAGSEATALSDHRDPDFAPQAQYYVLVTDVRAPARYAFGFRDIARATDERTAIGSIIPSLAAGNKLPLLIGVSARDAASIAGYFCSFVFDFLVRTKLHSTSLNWFIVEQLPVIPGKTYARVFGPTTAAALVQDHVLRLTYTAWDMEPFARDMGFEGPPFTWDETERRHLRARLDALYFHLYGVTDEDDIRYILSTFPIVERKDREAHGTYLTRDLILWYVRALAAGDPDAQAREADVIRQAMRAAA